MGLNPPLVVIRAVSGGLTVGVPAADTLEWRPGRDPGEGGDKTMGQAVLNGGFG